MNCVQEVRKRQKAARSSKVVMYRKYRVGELPDTQIKYSEIIRPFQALAQVKNMCVCVFICTFKYSASSFYQRDSNLARMLFSTLYCSLFEKMERELEETEAESAVKAIREGLNEVLDHSTEYYAPFIGSIQVNVCRCAGLVLCGFCAGSVFSREPA